LKDSPALSKLVSPILIFSALNEDSTELTVIFRQAQLQLQIHVLLEDLYLHSTEEVQVFRGGIIKYYQAVTVNAKNNEKAKQFK